MPYGEPPFPSELFAGEGVLVDLVGADERELPRILARYAALRAWLLSTMDDAPSVHSAVTLHAIAAARAHLDAVGADWEEGALLLRLIEGTGPAPQMLDAAAALAAARGHAAGARTLRQAAHRLRWRDTGFPPPSPS